MKRRYTYKSLFAFQDLCEDKLLIGDLFITLNKAVIPENHLVEYRLTLFPVNYSNNNSEKVIRKRKELLNTAINEVVLREFVPDKICVRWRGKINILSSMGINLDEKYYVLLNKLGCRIVITNESGNTALPIYKGADCVGFVFPCRTIPGQQYISYDSYLNDN